MKNILSFLLGAITCGVLVFVIQKNADLHDDQMKIIGCDRVLDAMELDGTIVAFVEKDSSVTGAPPIRKVALLNSPLNLKDAKQEGGPFVILSLKGKEWSKIEASDMSRSIVANLSEGDRFTKGIISSSRYTSMDENFDGFIDKRIIFSETGESILDRASIEYFTAEGIAKKSGRDSPTVLKDGRIVEVEWTENGYIIK